MQSLSWNSDNVTKKRARRACSPCRRRKVRCMRPHLPRANVHCESHNEGLEQWKAISSHDSNTSDRDDATCSSAQLQSSVINGKVFDSNAGSTPIQQRSQECGDEETEDNIVVSISAPEPTMAYGSTESSQVIPYHGSQHNFQNDASSRTEEQRPIHGTTNDDYAFLQMPEIHLLSPDDLRFLNHHGCFVVPKRSVLDEFMRQYFRYVHPMLPMFDEGDFWALYNNSRSGDEKRLADLKTPMVVLQAMLFATCGYVPEETIKELGFPTIVKAKLAFYNRTKLLYDLECESSPLAIAQATLLLSCCHLTPLPPVRCKVSGPLWLSIAVHHARDAGAHRYHLISIDDHAAAGRAQLQNRLKRLWWCCIINDRTMALAFRQNLNITRSCFDFDHAPPLTAVDLINESSHSEVYNADVKLCHAEMVAHLAVLCTIMTDVLAMTSVMHNSPIWDMRQSVAAMHRCSSFKLKLEVWYGSFSKIKSVITRDISQPSSSTASIILFTTTIELYYRSLMFDLGNYKILQLVTTTSLLSAKHDIIVEPEMINGQRSAIRHINECLRALKRENALTLLPISVIGCIAIALTLQTLEVDLLQLRNVNESACKDATSFFQSEDLDTLMKVMDIYRPRYYTVDWIEKTALYAVSLSRRWLHTCIPRNTEDASVLSWADILRSKPLNYLHLAMTVNLGISNGRLPEESEFPETLRNLPFDHIYTNTPSQHRAVEASTASRSTSADELTQQDLPQEQIERLINETTSVAMAGAHSEAQSMPELFQSHDDTRADSWSLPSLDRPIQIQSYRDGMGVCENAVIDTMGVDTPRTLELTGSIDFYNKTRSTGAVLDDVFIESLFEAEATLFLPHIEH